MISPEFHRHNNFTDLTSSAFGPIPTLLELHLDHNRLKTVSQAVANKLVSLRELTMSNNKLKKVPQVISMLNIFIVFIYFHTEKYVHSS